MPVEIVVTDANQPTLNNKNCLDGWMDLSNIKDILETTDNPFEGNESIFLSTDSRATQRRKGKSVRANLKQENMKILKYKPR